MRRLGQARTSGLVHGNPLKVGSEQTWRRQPMVGPPRHQRQWDKRQPPPFAFRSQGRACHRCMLPHDEVIHKQGQPVATVMAEPPNFQKRATPSVLGARRRKASLPAENLPTTPRCKTHQPMFAVRIERKEHRRMAVVRHDVGRTRLARKPGLLPHDPQFHAIWRFTRGRLNAIGTYRKPMRGGMDSSRSRIAAVPSLLGSRKATGSEQVRGHHSAST